MNEKRGFTLTELLGVIFLLGIIALVAIPPIIEQIKSSSKDISKATQKLIFSAADSYIDENKNEYLFAKGDVYCLKIETLINSDHLIENLTDIKTGKKIDINKVIKLEVENMANKDYSIVNENQCKENKLYIDKSGANKPQLINGMTPIKWSGTEWIATTENDSQWYNYKDKKWANAKTEDGSFWVWIPRYAYSITSGYHTSEAGTIEIKFLKNKTDMISDGTSTAPLPIYNGDQQTNFVKHPAFKFGDDEILGFWVAKFEPSGTSSNINIVPNVTSLREMKIGDQFDAAINMKNNNKYGWNATDVDTHMMKNDEWGAVAYLSISIYGANEEVWINNSETFTTGCAGDSIAAESFNGCQNEYHTEIGQKASTTHNIYGVYDMSGGSWESTASYVDNGHENLATHGQSILNAAPKYKNIYEVGATDTRENNYNANKAIFGDAVYETSLNDLGSTSWYKSYSFVAYSSVPWFLRGGAHYNTTNAGIFNFDSGDGGAFDSSGNVQNNATFRPVVFST